MIITGDIRRNLRIYSPPLELAASLKQLLTFNNPDYDSVARHSPYGTEYTTVPKTVCLAIQYPKYLELPRGYPYSKLLTGKAKLLFDKITWCDLRVTAPIKSPAVCRTKLNEDQELLVKKFLEARKDNLRPYGTYAFVAPTSSGKTLTQAYIASLTKQKTLVLCKTNLIRRAWEEDLTKHFGIPRNKIGRIQTTREDIGEQFTLGSLATLNRRQDKWDYLLGQFGCVVIDELQITGAETIRKVVSNCPAKYIIGMTATDHRKDGKTFVVHACLGRPLVRIQNKQEETSSSFPLGAVDIIRTDYEWLSPEGKVIEEPDFFGVCNDMRRDKVRNALIVSKVVEDWKKGNSVLVVSHRVSHCKLLRKKLAEAGVDDVNILTGETNAKKQYSEALVQSVLSGSVRCLVASKEVVKLGANLNPLNVLHCALPIGSASDLEQLVGRIRRKWKGKTGCRLVWYHDVKVPYLNSKYKRVLIPVLRKLKVPGWANVYVA